MPKSKARKFVAFCLSLIPGLGQVFLGWYFRGIVFFFLFIGLTDLTLVVLPRIETGSRLTKLLDPWLLLGPVAIIWLCNIWDMIRLTSDRKARSFREEVDTQGLDLLGLINQSRGLNEAEFAKVKKHTEYGYEILSKIAGLEQSVALVSLQHHERINRSGYPLGLRGDTIQDYAKIVGLVDVYEALTHPRPCRARFLPDEAMKMVTDLKATCFERELIKTLIEEISFYPPGCRVQLSSGEIGQGIGINKKKPFSPIVNIITDNQGALLEKPRTVDLSKQSSLFINKAIS